MFNFKVMNAAVKDDRITACQFRILYFLMNGIEDEKDVSIRFISSNLNIDKNTVKTALDKLEDAGYLQVLSNGDRKRSTIKLTV